MIRRPPRSTPLYSSAASDVYKRQVPHGVALDAWRSGDAYQVALDLPGVDPERIELICERNGLTIRAEPTRLRRISYAVFCLKKKKKKTTKPQAASYKT